MLEEVVVWNVWTLRRDNMQILTLSLSSIFCPSLPWLFLPALKEISLSDSCFVYNAR